MTNSPDYFDTLPVHPPPQPPESLTSYLMRLAEANGMGTVSKLSPLLFDRRLDAMRHLRKDYPPLSFGNLPALAECCESTLFSTTFYYLGVRFGRPERRQSAARFLKGSVAPHFRYCPQCIAERGFYSLAWRFVILPGCPDHGVRLLDRCKHCGQKILYRRPMLKLGYCPVCQKDLRTCQAERLCDAEIKQSKRRYRDLAFLLTPTQDNFSDGHPRERLGRSFMHWRQVRQVSLMDASRELGEKFVRLWSIELGGRRSGSTFLTYVRYADFLGVSLIDLFETLVDASREDRYLSEDATIEQLKEAAAKLRSLGKPVSARSVSKMVGLSRHRLKWHPRIKALLALFTEEWCADQRLRRERKEDALLQQIDEVIVKLQRDGIPITQPAIAAALGRSLKGLGLYPRVMERLKHATAERFYDGILGNRDRARELCALVEQAAQTLRSQQEPVTRQRIARVVGMTSQALKHYLEVRQLLERVVDTAEWKGGKAVTTTESELIAQTQCAIREMEARGLPITQKALCRKIGRSVTFLRKYPKVREIMLRAAAECSLRCERKGKTVEDELLMQVNQAIDHLRALKQLVTEKAICHLLGEWRERLIYYPRVRALVARVLEQTRQENRERVQQQGDKFFDEAQEAIRALRAAKQPLTQRAVCRSMGISLNCLLKYPRVRDLLRQIVRERRPYNVVVARSREDELLARVEKAIHALQAHKQPVTQMAIGKRVGMTPTGLRNYPRVRAILETISKRRSASQDGNASR